MVKRIFCDRCGKEIEEYNSQEINNGIGTDSFFAGLFNKGIFKKLDLCKNCFPLYKEIIKKANKEVEEYLKNSNKEKDNKK